MLKAGDALIAVEGAGGGLRSLGQNVQLPLALPVTFDLRPFRICILQLTFAFV